MPERKDAQTIAASNGIATDAAFGSVVSSTRPRQAKGEKLAWRTSIVDLMKALNLDSSLETAANTARENAENITWYPAFVRYLNNSGN
jgi:uncharacterized protein DUF3597